MKAIGDDFDEEMFKNLLENLFKKDENHDEQLDLEEFKSLYKDLAEEE